jgi:PKHD-type hydroxylase
MILKNYFWFFEKALNEELCNKIIDFCLTKQKQLATTGKENTKLEKKSKLSKKDIVQLKKIRNSDIVWTNEKWIYDAIHPYINIANANAEWNFDWNWSENCQFTIYEKNQHYGWHVDSFVDPYKSEDVNFNKKIRKLSVTCFLSDPKDYKGGELEFDLRNSVNEKSNIIKISLQKGSIVVFPSFVWHRVKPVTKGVRYSLVIWSLGYPFK